MIEFFKRLFRKKKVTTKKVSGLEFVADLVTFYYPAPKKETESEGLSHEVEGGTLDAHGNQLWRKTCLESGGPWVTVAMDPERRDLQKRYFISPEFPGVTFRVMDVGGFGRGRGTRWVDIASEDPAKSKKGTIKGVKFIEVV